MTHDPTAELVAYLTAGAPPPAGIRETIERTMRRIVDAGVPLHRFALFIFTHHPIVGGRRFIWSPEKGYDMQRAPYTFFGSDMYLKSPIRIVFEQGRPIRRRFIDGALSEDYADLSDLVAEGVTDYYAQPVIYLSGETHGMSWSTRSPEGFSQANIALLDRISPAMCRLIEIYILKLNGYAYLTTFLGEEAGRRVLEGKIHRGDAETLRAVILFADLVGFSHLSNERPTWEVLDTLNGFFDAIDGAITPLGGQILKFLGDGVLAIFPLESAAESKAQAAAALEALDAARSRPGVAAFRAALHLGEVVFGNIGSADRLDFTAIGPAVNLAARLLDEAGRRGETTLASAEFAALLPASFGAGEEATLKGFAGPRQVFRRV